MYYRFIFFAATLFCLPFSEETRNILLKSKTNDKVVLNYSKNISNNQHKDNLIEYISKNKDINNEINLPTQTTFYQIKDGRDINISYVVNDTEIISTEGLEDFSDIINEAIYPENNLFVSEPLIFRGVVVKEITFTPYKINFSNNTIEIYNDVDIYVEEYSTNEDINYTRVKLSRAFEPFYESMIPNYERSSREEDYQKPAVLYICGGNSLDNPYVQNLIDWRHKIGYIVYVVETSEIGSSSSSVKNYIQNAYENWENPPEIVGLIGDTSGSYSIGYFTENQSGYNGEGDFPYSQLDGADFMPEIFIGRISATSSSQLNNIINKTLIYERATYLNNGSDWYERGALCGDPSSSGNSTVITNEYIANILESYGFDDVRGNYGNGNYDNWLEEELEEGCLYMNYRGYYGVSGFGSGEINNANNSYKTPFAVFITCGTGDFSGTSLSEELIRAGSVANPKGAVAAIGTATTGTHTLFNNIVNMGIYDGIFPKALGTAGGAIASGRLSLYWTYPSNPNNYVTIFSHWNNLMGDPALQLWTDTPKEIDVEFSSSIDWGTNFIDVTVIDENGVAVDEAYVTVLKQDPWDATEDEIFATVKTNNLGIATIDLEYENAGEVFLTVTKPNHKPFEGSFDILFETIMINVDHENVLIIDSEDESDFIIGNGDNILNPGETVILEIPLTNFGVETGLNIQASLTSDSELFNIIYGVNQYGSLMPNESSVGSAFYLVSLDPTFTSVTNHELRLTINDGFDNQWLSLVHSNIGAANLVFDHLELIDNIELNPGESTEFRIFLTNNGDYALHNVELNLLASGYLIDILSEQAIFGDINPNETVSSTVHPTIYINGNTINGSILNANANVTSSNGYNQNIVFNINVGHVTQQDPLGPDEHGYYIYDSGDLGYSLAPIYDWIEIDNDYGGDGVELNLNDNGDGNGISNSSAVVSLPFDFTFYGVTYDEITINTNGWISFGESPLESFRNYPIPGAGGPSPMLAAFWDDLKTSGSAEIYTYSGGNYFVIEWSEMKTYFSNSTETFQIILYDDTNLTPTGDNEIKIQFKEFNNTTSGSYNWGGTHGGYSTIGIENHMSDIGLQYTFNNEYPTASMPLSDETAIFITTRNPVETLMGDANQDSEVNVIDIIIVVNHIINLELLDSMGVYVSDMDGNGLINILDVIQIINVILNSL